jgi:hypothetical protein
MSMARHEGSPHRRDKQQGKTKRKRVCAEQEVMSGAMAGYHTTLLTPAERSDISPRLQPGASLGQAQRHTAVGRESKRVRSGPNGCLVVKRGAIHPPASRRGPSGPTEVNRVSRLAGADDVDV